MSTDRNQNVYGDINGHLVGHVLKEAVRRATAAIKAQQFLFEAQSKTTDYNPTKEDFLTSADTAAQKIYVKILRECFPGFGIVAEEEGLSEPCTIEGADLWFTVDPLDGTKAFVRQQSHGIGTMISLVKADRVISAYVGDVMTNEIYGYRPGSLKVHRITGNGNSTRLSIDPRRPLKDQYLLLRDEPGKHSGVVQRMLNASPAERLDKAYEIGGGSIGIHFARLWKGEAGMTILRPGSNPPWDLMPVLGISRELGFDFLYLEDHGMGRTKLKVTRDIQHLDSEIFVVHSSRREEFLKGIAAFTV